MFKRTLIAIAFLPLTAGLVYAGNAYPPATVATTPVTVGDAQALMIGSEAHCVQSRGIPIADVPDNQVKVACLRDHNVQSACNPDGDHARQEAFRQWETQLMDFKERCSSVNGAFSFADAKFQEPTDATFCSQAQPEVAYSEFETPMCNFISRCPRIAVTCTKTEEILRNSPHLVSLPGIPKPISVTGY